MDFNQLIPTDYWPESVEIWEWYASPWVLLIASKNIITFDCILQIAWNLNMLLTSGSSAVKTLFCLHSCCHGNDSCEKEKCKNCQYLFFTILTENAYKTGFQTKKCVYKRDNHRFNNHHFNRKISQINSDDVFIQNKSRPTFTRRIFTRQIFQKSLQMGFLSLVWIALMLWLGVFFEAKRCFIMSIILQIPPQSMRS